MLYSYACSEKEKCGGEGVALSSLLGVYSDRIDDRADGYCRYAVSKRPLMQDLLQGNRLRSESIRFLRAINLARSEAVMRNGPVSICPSVMAVTGKAQCSGTYADGWIVFANADKDKVVDAGSDEVLQVFEGLPAGYQLTNRSGTRAAFKLINYLPSGPRTAIARCCSVLRAMRVCSR